MPATTHRHTGSTLIEIMISVAVLAILASIAVPSFQGLRERARLQAAAEAVYAQLQFARSESIKENRSLFIRITPGSSSTWCVGLLNDDDTNDDNTPPSCTCNDPSTTEPCEFGPTNNLMQRTLQGDDFPDVTLSSTAEAFGFESRRGSRIPSTDTAERTITLIGANNLKAQVTHNARGRFHLCGNVGGYPKCPP